MGKYIEDPQSHNALEAAALCADAISARMPYRYDGAAWVTDAGERHDLALLRRNLGDWLSALASAAEESSSRKESLLRAEGQRLTSEGDALVYASFGAEDKQDDQEAKRLRKEAQGLYNRGRECLARADKDDDGYGIPYLALARFLRAVATDMHSAPSGRARHLLELASQFDGFRAPSREPADWVATLGTVPRSKHVRTAQVWDAFCVAEPALSAKLGATGGRRTLYAAMDKRYGARAKLNGYTGWRGVGMPGT